MTDYLSTLMRYKAWANELTFAAAAKLPEAELTAPRKIIFGNLLRTLNHVYAMDEVWRAHLEGRQREPSRYSDPRVRPAADLGHPRCLQRADHDCRLQHQPCHERPEEERRDQA